MAGNTPVPDVVDAPTIGTATAGVEEATVTFTAAATGGAATSFGAISTPGSITGTSATSPITVSGLTAATAYTFKTYGINSSGTWSNVLSAASNSVTPTAATAYESISTAIVGAGGVGSVTFTSIPATYTHLQLRFSLIYSSSGNTPLFLNFNSDTGSNYSRHYLGASVTTKVSGGTANQSDMDIYGYQVGSDTVNPTVGIVDILEYKNTNIYKTIKTLVGCAASLGTNDGEINFNSNNWRSTSAITSISIDADFNFAQYSYFGLYGIKGA